MFKIQHYGSLVDAVAGLVPVMGASQAIFQAVQWIGAACICWMGVQLLRSKVGGYPAVRDAETANIPFLDGTGGRIASLIRVCVALPHGTCNV